MPRENVFARFRKSLARAAESKDATQDQIVDGVLFGARVKATQPSMSRTAPAASRKIRASRKVRAPA